MTAIVRDGIIRGTLTVVSPAIAHLEIRVAGNSPECVGLRAVAGQALRS
jgi:hypothetical protein